VLPPVLRELVTTRETRRVVADAGTAASMSGLRARMQGLTGAQRLSALVDLVCDNAATVLGRPGTADVDARQEFQDLGFDSLSAVELRNRLKSATGLTLSPTLIFDHPTPAALAEHLDTLLVATPSTEPADRMARFNDIARELQTLVDEPDWNPDEQTRLTARLQSILTSLSAPQPDRAPDHPDVFDDDINTASESQLFAILDDGSDP